MNGQRSVATKRVIGDLGAIPVGRRTRESET